ncbi:hypothetical protein BD779DRAFT_1784788 [Infundibulicybe gibba]|nr:hypothetical protein BD779DRAFT_1784788 [Infundibulicybe gibba]
MSLISTAIHRLFSFLSLRLEPLPDPVGSPDLTSTLQDVADFTRIRALRRAAVLALSIHENVQAIDHEYDLYLQLAADCCKAVNCVLSIPSIPPYTASSLPPSLAGNVDTLLRVLQDIHDFVRTQLCRLWLDRQITRRKDVTRIEQYQHNLNHLSRTFDGQLLCASGVEQRTLLDGPLFRTTLYHPPMVEISTPPAPTDTFPTDTSPVLSPLLSYRLNFVPTLPLLANMARGIYMLLLLFMPLLYSSRILGVLSDTNLDRQMRVLAPQPESDPVSQRREIAARSWDLFSRILVEEWNALRVLSSLVLGIRQNQTITAAALFLFVSVIYGSVLVIYVNGWRGTGSSSALAWIQGDDDSDVRNLIPSTLAEPTLSPRFTVTHPWFIPLFAIAMVYLVLMVYTLWRLSGHQGTTDRPTDMA